MIFSLVYRSRSMLPVDKRQDELDRILVTSHRHNSKDNVTGALLCDLYGFVQVLEGAEEVVLATYERILADPRHTDLRVILRENIERRACAGWSMALVGTGGPLARQALQRLEQEGESAARRLVSQMAVVAG